MFFAPIITSVIKSQPVPPPALVLMVRNTGLIFVKPPATFPTIGEHLTLEARVFDLNALPPEGGIIVKNIFLSLEPQQRLCMREPDNATWAPAFVPGQPIVCSAVSRVVKSSIPEITAGELVWGMFGAEEYSTVPPFLMPTVRKLDSFFGFDPLVYTSALGPVGLTAYASFYEFGKPRPGQTIFISSASGGVGQMVGQIAKLEGLHVIGSVGSDEKLDFILNDLDFDAGFNYKTERVVDALQRLAPGGVDIYFDNVGGETLDAALVAMKDFGRIISCGMISQYNLPYGSQYGVRNLMNIFLKRLTIHGFVISDPELSTKYANLFFQSMSEWLRDGRIKTKMSVTKGVENSGQAFLGMLRGTNFGKTVVQVGDVEE